MGICLVLGGSKPLPGFFVAVIYLQNGDLTKLLKSARKKVPQSARLSAGEGVQKLKGQCPNACGMNLRRASLSGYDSAKPNAFISDHSLFIIFHLSP